MALSLFTRFHLRNQAAKSVNIKFRLEKNCIHFFFFFFFVFSVRSFAPKSTSTSTHLINRGAPNEHKCLLFERKWVRGVRQTKKQMSEKKKNKWLKATTWISSFWLDRPKDYALRQQREKFSLSNAFKLLINIAVLMSGELLLCKTLGKLIFRKKNNVCQPFVRCTCLYVGQFDCFGAVPLRN